MMDYFLCKKKEKEEKTNEGVRINAPRHLFHSITGGYNMQKHCANYKAYNTNVS